jgi:glycerol-3-phosphate acyltransferase PlsX
MWNALISVEEGAAQACVSAGNTGALMAMSMMRLRKMDGVHRPALLANWPTARGFAAVLDVGANVEADASQLVEFAIMGEAFHRAVRGDARPKVGLLNVGAEDQKGHEEIRAAARLIREAGVDLDFHGFVEGDDISKGTVDVVVTDGFTGNIALKTAEGTARLVAGFLKEALAAGPLARIGSVLAYPALRKLKDRMDPRTANGAVFVGLNGIVVKSHGGTDGQGYAAAIDVAIRMAKSHYRDEVASNLARLAAAGLAPQQQAAAGLG